MGEDLKYYNEVYSKSNEYRKEPVGSIYYPIWADIVNMTNNTDKIIEVGCGSGQLAKLLIMNGKNYKHGFDYSYQAIKIAKKMNQDNEDLFSVANIYALSKGDLDDFDVVVCTEVLEHLDDDKYLFEILKPGTRVIFSVPDFLSNTHKRVFKGVKEIRDHYPNVNIVKSISHNTKFDGKIFLIDSICR